MRHADPPTLSGPAPHAMGVFFFDETRGFLATSAVGHRLQYPNASGEIQATGDAGTTWVTRWSDDDTSFTWIGFAGDVHGFAVGTRRAPGDGEWGQPLVVASVDAGATWVPIAAQVPLESLPWWRWYDFRFVSDLVGFAFDDVRNTSYPGISGSILRTADGGRTWAPVGVPGATGGLDFIDATTGYATGSGPCGGSQVWRSADAGRNWEALPGSCTSFFLYTVDFLDERTGFAAGGSGRYDPDRDVVEHTQDILATRDGGLTWEPVLSRTATYPIARLHMGDGGRGWAETGGGCKMGAEPPCPGPIMRTLDGGRSWETSGGLILRMATVGSEHAWKIPQDTNVLWRTHDGGRTWEPLARPDTLVANVRAAGTWLLLATDAGWFESTDAGASWQSFPLDERIPAYASWEMGPSGLLVSWRDGTVGVSEDAGRTWRTVPGPPIRARPYPFDLAFSDPLHGVILAGGDEEPALWMTNDAGATWRRLPAPPIDAGVLFLTDDLLAVSYAGRSLAVTEDAGATWQVHALPYPHDYCDLDAAGRKTFWMHCSSSGEGPSRVLVSNDAGGTWSGHTLPQGSRWGSIAAVSEREAWLSPTWFVGSSFWHTTDGGATWVEVWPKLPLPGW